MSEIVRFDIEIDPVSLKFEAVKNADGRFLLAADHTAELASLQSRIKELEFEYTACRSDASERIAELQGENLRLHAEVDRLNVSHQRYEFVRKLSARTFADVCKLNVSTGKPFDQIIDELIPFRQMCDSLEKAK